MFADGTLDVYIAQLLEAKLRLINTIESGLHGHIERQRYFGQWQTFQHQCSCDAPSKRVHRLANCFASEV
jgi:hypothetical protein